ncbi:Glyoxalase/bleomycin resistance protein/dioxygenase [Pseudonocardia dioxanivorans CB1190]|uniref:Glyoxalase/bleomycin resistance protein/dioxygenase n=1 Tax=Pseudonocardia dioxanivorans (strain ATCC 55486 / DSM 44775 / JCM 13855 / CB1190) TaxID=675635 RepID=F4CYY8_PSEUX|nr:VOC family protein [Pseudonocardia dioxanivorans]AEA27713.1 Glyoxalase/bleomycin resistance protein/dioxygenase [Pseudonocardia dioxanivorans CB1190]
MQYQLEVVVLPVADVDRSLAFYTEQVGFDLDVDYRPTDDFRVLQLTPPGSSCSVQLQLSSPRTAIAERTHYLVVPDVEKARRELLDRGVAVGEVRHKAPVDRWAGGWDVGVDPEHRDYASTAELVDPDGNVWVLQERGHAEGPR